MNQHLQKIQEFIQQTEALSAEEKAALSKTVKNIDTELTITEFKLDRTEKVKRTTAILLEETIEELEHKRKAVEEKNHELEIESALERVRTVAMSMIKPDDLLGICETMFHELKKLGFDDLRNAMIDVHYDDKKYLLNYDYSGTTGKTITNFAYNSHQIVDNIINHARHSHEGFTEMVYSGKALDEWRIFRKDHGEPDDSRLDNVEALYYYFYSIDTGAIGISAFSVVNSEQLIVLKRFRNVFELAYRRYIDIQLAGSQAREAQIELALERVRARTMAMQHSAELLDAAAILFKQVKELSVQVWSCGFQIWKPGEPGVTVAYMTLPDGNIRAPFEIPHIPEPFLNRAYEAAERADQFYVEELGGDDLAAHYKYMLALPGVSDRMVDISAGGFQLPEFQVNHNAYFAQGALLFITYKPVPESWDIFKRFAKVFEGTYTRFLDLKQAEEQARESQIQLALERVRARTMAMQKSDELPETSALLFQQVKELGEIAIQNSIAIVNEEAGFVELSTTIHGSHLLHTLNVPINDPYLMVKAVAAWKEKRKSLTLTFEGQELKDYNELRNSFLETKISFPEDHWIVNISFFSKGWLSFSSNKNVSGEIIGVQKRFATVFDQTYTRFLDLQKAEAQAREGQIELALERVRARTMAMQRSDELAETAFILFQQFKELGESPDQATIGIVNEDEWVIEYWVTMYGSQINKVFKFSIDEPNVTNKIYKAWKAQKKSLVIDLSGQDLYDFTIYRAGMGGAAFNPDEKRRVINVAFFSKGLINVQSNEERSAESIRLLERFAAVFEGTYTRFLDLKNAEAQARESQIQLGLERVRAKAMAMQNANELVDVIGKVYDELTTLDISFTRTAIIIFDPQDLSSKWWMASAEESGAPQGLYIKYHDYLPYISMLAAWKRLEEKWEYVLQDEDKKTWDHFLFTETEISVLPDHVKVGMGAPGKIMLNLSFGNFGGLSASSVEPMTAANKEIIKRFARAFDLTYTRFLDLKQAEAQAREAQVELALERVRARTMAMQHSDELKEVIQVIYEQFVHLQLDIVSAGFIMDYKESGGWNMWMADAFHSFPNQVHVPYFDHPHWNGFNEAKRKGLDAYVTTLTFEEKNGFFEQISKYIPGTAEGYELIFRSPGYAVSNVLLKNVSLFIDRYAPVPFSEADNAILKRFGNVFEQTYTRFNDLKQAEEQAHESQIQLALERVRARTMAMQRSDELAETATVLFQQLHNLDVIPERVFVGIPIEGARKIDIWGTEQGGNRMGTRFEVDADATFAFRQVFKAWEGKQPACAILLKDKDLAEHINHIAAIMHLPITVELVQDQRMLYCANFSRGILVMVTPDVQSEETLNILQRFAAVFDQTYTRFIDLQKAEAQAKEARIEAALEKVRSRSLAMHKTEELQEVVSVVFEKLHELEFVMDGGAIIFTFTEGSKDVIQWIANPGQSIANRFVTPFIDHSIPADLWRAKESGKDFFAKVYSFEEKNAFFKAAFELSEYKYFPDDVKNAILDCEGYSNSVALSKNSAILIPNYNGTLFSEQENDILKRFARVFEQAYVRFLDLQKAEAQAREAQIEAALERTRTQSMIMQHSNELDDTLHVFHEQVLHLGINSAFSFLWLPDEEKDRHIFWAAWAENDSKKFKSKAIDYPLDRADAATAQCLIDWKGNNPVVSYHVPPEGVESYFAAWQELIDGVEQLKPEYFGEGLFYVESFMKYGCFGVVVGSALAKEEKKILGRFAIEFERTYTRFLDLQKAEAQAREAQIELSLERVRAKTMAMHTSEHVGETVATMFDELIKLGIEKTARCGISIIDENQDKEIWIWRASYNQDGKVEMLVGAVDIAVHALFKGIYDAWKNKETIFTYELAGDDQQDYFRQLNNAPRYAAQYNLDLLPEKQINNTFFFPEGAIFAFTLEPLSTEQSKLFKRFAGVFGLTYRRFLDLQKAEAQTREAKIEAGLERVRSKAMAMHSSENLAETINVFYHELALLSATPRRCGLGLLNRETHTAEISTVNTTAQGEPVEVIGKMEVTGHPVLQGIYDNWLLQKEYHPVLRGNEIKAYYEFMRPQMSYPDYSDDTVQYGYFFFFADGGAFAWTDTELPEDELQIYRRFNSVLSLTYRRYKDIKEAEEQAREAQIQLALERVRARTMAMQKSEELRDVIQLVFEQLYQLNFNIDAATFVLDYKDSDDFDLWMAVQGQEYPTKVHIPYFDHPMFTRFIEAKKTGSDFFAILSSREEKNKWFDRFFENSPGRSEEEKNWVYNTPGYASSNVLMNTIYLGIANLAAVPYSDAENATLMRFGKVFEQTYRRFADLKQAEEQAKESQIQLALERVRARTMAMQHSSELAETSVEVFKQLIGLGIQPNRLFIGIIKDESGDIELWATDEDGSKISTKFTGNIHRNHSVKKMYAGWKEHQTSLTIDMRGKELKDYFSYLAEELKVPFKLGLSQKRRVQLITYFSQGFIGMASSEVQPEETVRLLERFAGVFNLTYTRFNDLKQAEEQIKEARIESALERVRSKTMAMHNSGHVAETVATMFDELLTLGVDLSMRCGIGIIDETKHMEVWTAFSDQDSGKTGLVTGLLDMTSHQMLNGVFNNWKNKELHSTYMLTGKDQEDYYHALNNSDHYGIKFDIAALPVKQYQNAFYFREGFIYVFTHEQLEEDQVQIYKRFASVFGLTYRRYLDLKQAEEQAVEAQIELGLERVRAKATAMQQSNELMGVVATVFGELTKLNFILTRFAITIMEADGHTGREWTAELDGSVSSYLLKYTNFPYQKKMINAWTKRLSGWVYELKGEEMKALTHYLITETGYSRIPEQAKKIMLDTPRIILSHSFNNFGFLRADSLEPLSEKNLEILARFSKVFDLTYTRFRDLKQAEEQVRESKIEAALEKVRGKALAMYSSKDLSSTVSMVFTELRKLGISPLRCGVGMASKDSRKVALYSATKSDDGDGLALVGWVMLLGHPVLEKIYDSIISGEDYFPVLKGKQLKSYYQKLLSGLTLPSLPDFRPGDEQYGHFFPFPDGCLYAWAEKPYNDADVRILKRFASVIDLTFRRYIELQKSEAGAREAVKQASLDRVRAEIASMRTFSDLERITPLIWNELTILGVPFIRCGVFIMDEPQQLIHTYLSTPDGKAIAAFQLHFNADTGNGVNGAALRGWRQKQMVTLHWTEEEFRNFSHSLVEQGELATEEGYLTERPPSGLDLHFFPFLQGMLYAGNTEPLSDNDKDLVQSLADAFSTAYARYEDFNRLELAKQEVENTLSDLKTAQTRLIQSEKMASLGELTAGIAHEIQNPLNFVNNFSEVNQEMIDELEEELKAGNIEEALALASDIKQNEQKINHHGKRADGIVKGMLQHSRTNSNDKSLTNINSVADEYMRLSYHGLRAKDKVFNAEMVMLFDPNLPRVEAIGQDIGRVFLNLFNNAFYAVNQKKKTAGPGYSPTVTVSTYTENGQVVIKVADNGTGMPDYIKEKIMQPFFTTKPTGEGTGLGLSLTYDMVVKGHGGSIQVNSVEGEGSEFIITLPIN